MILPSFSELEDSGILGGQDERYRAHRAVRELLERVAATKPLVLLLDDVHWADPASVELIGALLRRPPDAPVLLAMAGRPRQLPQRLEAAFDRAERDGLASRIALAPLTREEAEVLLGGDVDPAAAGSFYEESGGNPFYLEQLARSPRRSAAAGDSAALGLAEVDVPGPVASALREELAMLSPDARTLLSGASVAGDPFELELAAVTADLDEGATAIALDELIASGLLGPGDAPRRFRFRHPLVRHAVYASTAPGSILGAHARCSVELARQGAPPTVRAHHVEYAARQGDKQAIDLLREAGEKTAMRAPATAARWFGAALRLLPNQATPEERLGLLLARARVLAATGEFAASREDLLEGLELTSDGPIATWVELTVACAGVEHALTAHAEAHARLVDALGRLPDSGGPEAVALLIELAFDGLFRGDLSEMRDSAERALATARPLEDTALTAYAAAVVTQARAWGGTHAEALEARAEALPLVDGLSDEDVARRLGAVVHLAGAEMYMDLYEEAAAHAARAQVIARATGQVFPALIPTLVTAYYMRGQLGPAIEVIERGVESARLVNSALDLAWRLHIRSAAALAAGDLATARSAADEAYELTRDAGENFVSAYPGLGLASALHAGGESARAIEILLDAAGGEELRLIPGGWRAGVHEFLVNCHLELGQREDAARAAGYAASRAQAVGLPMASAWAARAAAAVALDTGEVDTATTEAVRAIEISSEAGCAIEEGVSRTLAARAFAAAGNNEQAVAELEQAVDVLEDCGALRHRDEATLELRKLGHRVHRQSRVGRGEGVDSLSERELEVARLVVDRKTNAEIAGELFLSVKTIESHMRNLFRKLDVSSRVEVARAIERADSGL